jgi:hypothetical protein
MKKVSECSVDDCDKEAGMSGRCPRHSRIAPRRTVNMGYDKHSISTASRQFPGGLDSVRTNLVESLAEAVGDDCANAITDALDAYLETDPGDRLPAFQWLPPDHKVELDKAIKQRDEAVARANRAEQKLTKAKRRRP